MNNLQFLVSGPNAEQAARTLARLAWEGEGAGPEPQIRLAPPSRKASDKVVDPVSVATLIVALPPAILSVVDLVDRLHKRVRAKKLINAALHAEQQSHAIISIISVDDTAHPLSGLTADQLLELATAVGSR
jgi:hypothetical protein